jgi:hypothetical protein
MVQRYGIRELSGAGLSADLQQSSRYVAFPMPQYRTQVRFIEPLSID